MKRLAAVLAALLLLFCGASCGIRADDASAGASLTILDYPGRSMNLQRAVRLFQARHPDVAVTVLDNDGDTDTWDSYAAGISAEIMSGCGPDLIVSPHLILGVDECIAKLMKNGVFHELNTFMEAQPDFQKNAFLQPVIQSGSLNGIQYIMPLGYTIPCILTSENALEQSGIRIENCHTYLGFAEELDRYLSSSPETPLWLRNAEDYSPYFPACLGLNYADYETEQADFSASEWGGILPLYKRYNGAVPFDRRIDTFTDGGAVRDGRCIFTMAGINSGKSLFYHTGVIQSEMQAEWIPIPTVDGEYGAFVRESIAICASSKQVDLAEDFIRLMLSAEIQGSYNPYSFPVRRECLIRRYQQGNEDLRRNGYPPLDPVWQERMENFTDHISTVYYSIHDTVTFFEYLQPYFDGEKSRQKCLEDLENYYSIFLSE